ncbi:hypothetical protein [Campylobacter gastrosuis]|uniref:Transcriptional regulator n=1 Tax=Campylobacter gastrosuis TaxID=2974576 RepID=A0ABT7HSZ2_9BACT|nr:hypothetical protein [Campylobacter gastrosuis]MDL0089985.1 hypothetical protein [Campylobacter gastrosuis]
MKIGTKSLKFEDVKNDILKNEEVKKIYDSLKDEYELIMALIEARNEAKLTQSELAHV